MSALVERFRQARRAGDPDAAVALIPYARFIGVRFHETADGGLLFRLPYSARNVGNPYLPALHGGVIGAFMENAAIMELLWGEEAACLPRVVDFSVDYLRPGLASELLARCDRQRQGARIANMVVSAYQTGASGDRVVAVARGHFLTA